jgi:hypothetical protein
VTPIDLDLAGGRAPMPMRTAQKLCALSALVLAVGAGLLGTYAMFTTRHLWIVRVVAATAVASYCLGVVAGFVKATRECKKSIEQAGASGARVNPDNRVYEAMEKVNAVRAKYGLAPVTRRVGPRGVHVYPANEEHDTDGADCWCGPRVKCSECLAEPPCVHGAKRSTLIIHKQAS